jgi:hypothetical protein
MAWKGAYAITYGTGNSQGCFTLTSSNVVITNQTNFGNRGYCIELSGLLSTTITAINVYAPNGYAQEKRNFFENILNHIEINLVNNVFLAGDFNLTFDNNDRHNRSTQVAILLCFLSPT